MGQYFHACILKKNKKTVEKWLLAHDFDNGLKLMEHSWIENPFVKTFECLIHNNPQIVVWARDLISVSDKVPDGFKEIGFDLYED